MKKMRYYDDGGAVGYEEDPKPGVQSDRQDFQPGLKVDTKDKPKDQTRSKSKVVPKKKDRVNLMDDLTSFVNLPSSNDNETEGGPTQRNTPRNSPKPKGIPLPSDRARGFRDQVKESDAMSSEDREALKNIAMGLAVPPAARALGMVGRGLQVANRQRIIGRNYEAMSAAQQRMAANAANLAARPVQTRTVVDGMKSGGSTGRGGGCEIRGKTKGRMV
jgi:hypothetical protein